IYDEPAFTGYWLSVRVYDGVHACGILLVPKGMRPGERRPVVFTEHGFTGRPEDALGVVESAQTQYYSRFGMRLAERGYIVFAPMISTQNDPERQGLVRRAYLVGMTVVGLEATKFGRALDYLSTLPLQSRALARQRQERGVAVPGGFRPGAGASFRSLVPFPA